MNNVIKRMPGSFQVPQKQIEPEPCDLRHYGDLGRGQTTHTHRGNSHHTIHTHTQGREIHELRLNILQDNQIQILWKWHQQPGKVKRRCNF